MARKIGSRFPVLLSGLADEQYREQNTGGLDAPLPRGRMMEDGECVSILMILILYSRLIK